jgi:hypothetical protein
MDPVPERFRGVIADVVARVADGDYAGLKRDGIDPHPDADLSMWIREYGDRGATVVRLPEAAWEFAEAFPAEGVPGTWFVVVDLWTAEEGHSDLSMEATVREVGDGVVVTIDDLHVL